MLLLLAELTATPATAAEVEQILTRLAETANMEPGTLGYMVHRPQGAPDTFLLTELYASRAACDAHLASPPVRAALARFESLLSAPPQIRFCDALAGFARRFDLALENKYTAV